MSNTINRFDSWADVETAINRFGCDVFDQLQWTSAKLRALQADAASEPATAITLERCLKTAADASLSALHRWQLLQALFAQHSADLDKRAQRPALHLVRTKTGE